ncbi:MAG: hypothetical protein ABI282_10070 [Candidatus Baltobacteraceae bacterium]
MKYLAALLLLFIISPMPVPAQTATPSAPPQNPHEYSDPGMHFTAPDNWVLAGARRLPLKDLTDNLQIVAGWVLKSRDVPQSITLSEQIFEGDITGYETRFESDLRGTIDGALVKSSQRTSLTNGMPAYFVDISYGSGFTSRKEYAYIWADGARGVALAITGRVGEIDSTMAKKALSNVSAVRYPFDRE